MVPSEARPMGPPTCGVTLPKPDARPASAAGTSDIEIVSSGMKDMPPPSPSSGYAAKIRGKQAACAVAAATRRREEPVAERSLEGDEAAAEREVSAAEAKCVDRGPALLRGCDERIDAEHQRARDDDRAKHVDALAQPESGAFLDQPRAEYERRDADGQVDEEDPVPVDPLGEHASGEQAKRAAAGDHEREPAHGLRPRERRLEGRDADRADDAT